MKRLLMMAALLGAALPAHAEIMVHDAIVKLGIGERPGIMFAGFHNMGAATQMIAADSPSFERIELHTHTHDANGMMRMEKVDRFPLPAKGMLKLQPGGDHLMLFGFRGETGDEVTLTLRFADGRTATVSAVTQARQKKSKSMKMDGHHSGHKSGHHGH
jgi:periplasmic copper chaperone A